MNTTRVLALLPLFVVLAHSFSSWDIVVGVGKQLKFYKNGTLIHTEDNLSPEGIFSVAYDQVHFKVLFINYSTSITSISSFDLTTKKIESLVTRVTINPLYMTLAYDPVTELLFWNEDREIYSLSLKPASTNKANHGNLLVTLDYNCRAIAVDSCGGYIHWITDSNIERATFDGSNREVLINDKVLNRQSLAIDQKTQKMYWTEVRSGSDPYHFPMYIEYAELNGKNRSTLYSKSDIGSGASTLVISNDFIYWKSYREKAIMQLPKNKQLDVEPKVYLSSSTHMWDCQLIAANYTIMEQTQGTTACEALKSLIPKPPASNTSDVHVMNVSEECYRSTCQYYCFRGNCSVTAEGSPKCSCEAGYSGERCEVNACHMYCLHGGVCSLNEEQEPVCQCTVEYEGQRCDVAVSLTGVNAEDAKQEILRDLRRQAKKIIKEELKRALQFVSDKIDEYEVKI